MSRHTPPPGRAPDYTNAFFVSFGVLLFFFFMVIHVIWGFLWALITAFGLDKLISRFRPSGS